MAWVVAMTPRETKQYCVAGKLYTLVLKQLADNSWKCEAYDQGYQRVADVPHMMTKRSAQYLGHAVLYAKHSLRCDQRCQDECDKDWKVVPD